MTCVSLSVSRYYRLISSTYIYNHILMITIIIIRFSLRSPVHRNIELSYILRRSREHGSARITIFDTTLRDGEQSPGCSMNVQEKLRLAHQLDRLGVDVIEAGFPDRLRWRFRSRASDRRGSCGGPSSPAWPAPAQPDIERAWQALEGAARPRIHVFLATSDIHLQYKLRITREQCLEQARDAVRLAKSLCADVEFSPEDATRTDHEFLCPGAWRR